MKLETKYGTYELELIRNEYISNKRTYFGLVDKSDGEMYCDLTENHADISDEQIYGRLDGHEAVIIDHDFLNLFDEPRLAKIWIKENIPECVITGDIDGLDCFYIKKE